MIRMLLLVFLIVTGLKGISQKKKGKEQNTNFTIQQLAPGIWAAIHNDQFGKAICNAGIVDLGDKTLIYDPFMNPQAARELRTAAEELTGRPATLVVNSHYHNDHIRGNYVFLPYATIISTAFTRNKMEVVEPEEQKWERQHAAGLLKASRKMYQSAVGLDREELPLWIGYYEGMMESADDLKITLPDLLFTDSLWIRGSKYDVKLVEYKNGHTGSDVVLMIPSEKVAFLGDLLFVQRHPWLSDGIPDSWQANLKKLYGDSQIETYLPGHGPVSKKEAVLELHDYISTVQKMADQCDSDSLKADLLMKPIPSKYQGWYFSRFYHPNMKFLFTNRGKTLKVTPE